jgi:amidase
VSSDVVAVLDAAGAVSLGKTAAPELGFPSYTETLVGPPARNPWDTSRGAGGSSGGAAVAVAAGLLPVAPGSDGGGSIRIPAAACGLVGLKPTRGLLPAGGGVEQLGGLVVHGPLARTVSDAALLLEGMLPRDAAGEVVHPRTLRTAAGPRGSYLAAARRAEVPGRPVLRVGVSTFSAWEGAYEIALDPPARAALDLAAREIAGLGHAVTDAGRWEPDPAYAPAFRTLWMAGAAAVPIDDPERLALLEPLTQWLVGQGRTVTARALAEALGALAAFERRLVARVAEHDVVLLPGMAMTPRPLGWYDADDPERNFAQQCAYTPYTSMINVAGLPALAVPVHWTDPEPGAPAGLPMGVQLVGRPGGEHVLLALAAQLEDRLRWPDRRPPVW